MELKILKEIEKSLDKGTKVALVTVTEAKGSTPSTNGDIMAVWPDRTILGTIGGGKLELQTIEKAVECINKSANLEISYDLTPHSELGMECGGSTKIYIKVFIPKPRLSVIGGGHIGAKLYELGIFLGFQVDIFDDREAFCCKERFPQADNLFFGKYTETLPDYNVHENTYIVIATSGHKGDKESLEALAAKKWAYLGMIGSLRKINGIFNELLEKGVSREILDKINSPMGIDVNSNEPAEIALGIMMEILLVKNSARLEHMKNIKKAEVL